MTKSVKVKAKVDQSGVVDFEVDGIKAQHSRLKLDKDSGEQTINFELNDHSGKGLQFNLGDPLWLGEDCPCPPTQGIHSDQIRVTDIGSQHLEITNSNSGRARELRYQLNFVASDGSALNCDPVIENGGGIKT